MTDMDAPLKMQRRRCSTWLLLLCGVIEMASRLPNVSTDGHKDSKGAGEYKWRSLDWSPCASDGCNVPGWRMRRVECISGKDRTTVASHHCKAPKPVSKAMCITHNCLANFTTFRVSVKHWSPCIGEPVNMAIGATFGKSFINNDIEHAIRVERHMLPTLLKCKTRENTVRFVQRRLLNCIAFWPKTFLALEVNKKHCRSIVNLAKVRVCSYGCRKPCGVMEWSSWQMCSICRRRTMYRQRELESLPTLATDPCPSFFEIKREKRSDAMKSKRVYQIKTGPWSSCRSTKNPSEATTAEKGLKVGAKERTVQCLGQGGKEVSFSRCRSRGLSGSLKSRSCVLSRDCCVSEWSLWSSCTMTESPDGPSTANRGRRRSIQVIATEGGRPCGHLNETQSCAMERTSSVTRSTHHWFKSDWGPCNVRSNDSSVRASAAQNGRSGCGVGSQKRSVFCAKDSSGNQPVVDALCVAEGELPISERACTVECPGDCILGDWDPWGSCIGRCHGNHTGAITGTIYRTRKVIHFITDPRACHGYAESRPCRLNNCAGTWKVRSRTSCVLIKNGVSKCGTGRVYNAAICVNAQGKRVHNKFCLEILKPLPFAACSIPCPDDCVLSQWSQWSICSKPCKKNQSEDSGGQQRVRSIMANAGSSGRPCLEPLVEMRSCNEIECSKFGWKVEDWSECHSASSYLSGRCHAGIMRREVNCWALGDGRRVLNHFCTAVLRPPSMAQCQACPKDCAVSPWAEWSECSPSVEGLVTQRTRQRHVTQFPRDGGSPCNESMALTETLKCRYGLACHWNVSAWGNCELATGDSCHGIRVRRVVCVRNSDLATMDDASCMRQTGSKPSEFESCANGCQGNCTMAPWTSWAKCSKRCGGGISRSMRSAFPVGPAACPKNVEVERMRRCNQQRCLKYTLRMSSWSSCQATDGMKRCGWGVQWRNVTCQRMNGRPAPLEYCFESLYDEQVTPAVERLCFIPCPVDCAMSPWTRWSDCSKSCGTGTMSRRRHIVWDAAHDGLRCPPSDDKQNVIQIKPCRSTHCHGFNWRPGPWSQCDIVNQTAGVNTTCGQGFRHRIMACIDSSSTQGEATTDPQNCDANNKPHSEENCEMSCPGNCVVGEWGQWSSCVRNCPLIGLRRRDRKLLRIPSAFGGPCPPLRQFRPCPRDSCLSYSWSYTNWSSCFLIDVTTNCGMGVQTRLVDCKRGDDKILNPLKCDLQRQKMEPLSRSCYSSCPRSCKLSEWTAWTTCPEKCRETGVQTRERWILATPKSPAMQCPSSEGLREIRHCPMSPCYQVVLGAWSVCHSDVGGCGIGFQTRPVDCVRDDRKVVDGMTCIRIAQGEFSSKRPCSIICRSDCLLSSWTPWSACVGQCSWNQSAIAGTGLRKRSRTVLQKASKGGSPCNNTLTETRQCLQFKCRTYEWKMSYLANGLREVWCERSDGINVTHACNEVQKPAGEGSCWPPCNATHSICTKLQTCACLEGFTARFDQNASQIIACERDQEVQENEVDYTLPRVVLSSSKEGLSKPSLPPFIWIVIGVCLFYSVIFIVGVFIILRRRRVRKRERRQERLRNQYHVQQVQQNASDVLQLETLLAAADRRDAKKPAVSADDQEMTEEKQAMMPTTAFIAASTLPKKYKKSTSTRNSSVSSGRGSFSLCEEPTEEDWPEPPVELMDAKTWHARQRGLCYTGMVYRPARGSGTPHSEAYDEIDFNQILSDKTKH